MNSAQKKNLPIPDLTLKNRGSEMIGKKSKIRPINRDRRSDLAALCLSQMLQIIYVVCNFALKNIKNQTEKSFKLFYISVADNKMMCAHTIIGNEKLFKDKLTES